MTGPEVEGPAVPCCNGHSRENDAALGVQPLVDGAQIKPEPTGIYANFITILSLLTILAVINLM